MRARMLSVFFFFNDTATTEIYTLSLHDALPISSCNVCTEADERRAAILQMAPDGSGARVYARGLRNAVGFVFHSVTGELWARSEEHTSELQSRQYLVCRLLLEKKKKK